MSQAAKPRRLDDSTHCLYVNT